MGVVGSCLRDGRAEVGGDPGHPPRRRGVGAVLHGRVGAVAGDSGSDERSEETLGRTGEVVAGAGEKR